MSVLKSVNPYNPSRIVNYPQVTDMNLVVLLGRARTAFKTFRNTSFKYREQLMMRVGSILRDRSREFAELITREMGKPVNEAEAEVRKCAWVCEFYAEHAEEFLERRIVETEAEESQVIYQPLGPILAIMPWNFPFWQVFRFAAPSLMAGNTALLKHASNVQGCAQAIEEIFTKAGSEVGVFQNLAISSDRVAGVVAHEYIKAITLTGSETAGIAVASEAGRHLKKCVLELGGNNAFVVLNDANQELALNIALSARLQNAGQSCIAAKRFILESWIAEDFVPQLMKRVGQLVVGDPMEEETDIGPLSSVKQAEEVEKQVKDSVEKGAKLITGGHRNGAFYEPTIITGVQPGMRVFDEEVFGPVFAVLEADSPEHALELSNQSRFGLGLQVFTQSESSAQLFIAGADEGAVFINAMVKSDPRLPFGGVKNSGYGRELSVEGIREFVNIKTIWID
ncbi:MAG: NAD-dependent succinate-semialdehyde dehydrogenase [Bacteroidales bacterium]|nr:NAD-dependent succinate-semialdehyde dehydrogenase [Bacteroidales bacterium]